LAAELSKVATGRTMYILDEPTTGLHFADIQRLLEVLDRLVEAGNSVVVIEHNLDVIKVSDWLIDLGPEGGDEGGQVIAIGTPEEVAAEPRSYTGQFLSGLLEVKAKRGRKPAARGSARANGARTAKRAANGSKTAEGSANGSKNGKTPANGSGNGSGTRRRTSAGKR
jgi:excinuclease ABC subunit A